MYRILELYSGIGGMHCAWKESEIPGTIIAAIDINTVANQVYSHNFPQTNLLNRNVQSLSPEFIISLRPNIVLMSPPCQPFTRNGLQKDQTDPRTDSFKYFLSILKNLTNVNYILLENVKGFEVSGMRNIFVKTLRECGFFFQEFLLTPTQFGIPNSRLRYYCLARRKPFEDLDSNDNEISTQNPCKTDSQCFTIGSIIDDNILDEQSYLLPDKFVKRAFVIDICYDDSQNSCCFTKAYTHFLEGTGSLFTKVSKNEVQLAFDELQESGYDTKVKQLNLRFFTPNEVMRLMAFPSYISFPANITKKQSYRLLGNSINVKVVSELIKYLLKS